MADEFQAGWVGGLAQVVFGHPLDTIKVRLQAQPGGKKASYRGTFHCISSIIRHESVFGMFKGMMSPMLSITTINAIAFGVRGNVLKHYDSPTIFDHFIAGAAAGAAQVPLSCPSELAKIRIQMHGVGEQLNLQKHKGSMRTLVRIYRTEGGITGCYRGILVTILRDVPAFGIYFMSYEVARRDFVRRNYPELLTESLAGGIGGVASWMITYALDSIKSRIQADGVGGVNTFKGLSDAVYQSLRNESIFDLHRGMGVAIIRAFFVNAFVFTAVIYSKKFLTQT